MPAFTYPASPDKPTVDPVQVQRERVLKAMNKLARELAKLDELEPQKDFTADDPETADTVGHVAIVHSGQRAALFNSSKVDWKHSGIRATWLGGQYGQPAWFQWYTGE